MPRKRTRRLYTKRGRYYADFRDYSDVGGGKEALIPPGQRFATTQKQEAKRLGRARLAELKAKREAGESTERDLARLGDFVDFYLEKQAGKPGVHVGRLKQRAQRLEYAIGHFGALTRMRDIDTLTISGYLEALSTKPRGNAARGQDIVPPISSATQRKYLHALTKLYRSARKFRFVPMAHDPFKDLDDEDIPSAAPREEADWLEADEAALILFAASLYQPKRSDSIPYAHVLIAVLLLTGMRLNEALGLRVEDVELERHTIRVRRHITRRLKTPGSSRSVPIHPQLFDILIKYLRSDAAPTGEYMFPSPREDGYLTTVDRLLEELAVRVGRTSMGSRIFRHTYCAARLQTTDNGAPVSLYTVSRELGHGSDQMVKQIYGHLGEIRPRGEHVEFRVEHFESPGFRASMLEVERISAERNKAQPQKKKLPASVELAAIEIAAEDPRSGPRPASQRLATRGIQISPSGVRLAWKRYGLGSIEERLEALASGRLVKLVRQLRSELAAAA